MAKQTFTTGQVLTAAQMTSLQQTAMGGGSATAKTASYTLVAADAGTTVAMNAAGATTITVNTGLFAAGDTVFIQNLGAGACTVTAGTATVATAGSLILPQNDAGILYFTSASAAIFYDYIQAGAVSPLTTKGDLYTFSTSDARLGVGANGTTLVADSSEATGLKWATPASGGGMTLLSTTTLTGASITLNSFSGYNNLQLIIRNFKPATDGADLRLQVNADSGANRHKTQSTVGGAGPVSFNATNWLIAEAQDDTTAEGLCFVQIVDYANTTTFKAANSYAIMNNANVVTDFNSQNSVFYYNQTGAITSLVIFPSAGNFTSGTALLYGVK